MDLLRAEVTKIVKRRLDLCRAGGSFTPAKLGHDFGINLEIEGDKAVASFEAFTPEGATLLTELAEVRFFYA